MKDKDNILRDKIISFGAGILIGLVIMATIGYFIGGKGQGKLGKNGSMGNQNTRGEFGTQGQRGNFDTKNMTDEQLERIATKAGITKEELKKKLDSGESLRDIMPQRTGSGSNFGARGGNIQNTGTGSN